MQLGGKRVLITGGARGIGAAVAAECAGRGARVSVVGLEPEELGAVADGLGEGHLHHAADVTDRGSLGSAVERTVEAFGGLDMVLANAGIATYGTVEKVDPRAFMLTLEINLAGVFHTAQLTLPHLLRSGGWLGAVASIASYAPLPGAASYNASKAGVELMVRALRVEVGWRGVAVSSIHPSWIDTDLVRDSRTDLESFAEMRSKMPWPLRATTSPQRCAELIVDGAIARRDRIFIPPSARLIYWLRNVVGSGIGERVLMREAPTVVPRMDEELARLGRSASERTAAINRLGADEAPDGEPDSERDRL